MLDISKQSIHVGCKCGRKHTITFKDVMNKRIINCLCGAAIQLKDDGSVKKSVTDINNAFKKFENTFKRFGK